MICSKCGKEIEDLSLYCRYCGNKVESLLEEQDDSSVLSNEINKKEETESIHLAVSISALLKKINVLKLGKILSLIGIAGFVLTALIELIVYGGIYFYNGYNFTKVICTICIVLMLLGVVAFVCEVLFFKKKNFDGNTKKGKIISIVIVAISLICSTLLIVNGISNAKKESSSGSQYSASSYEMDHSTYCLLYMKVSNVKVSHKGKYTYVTGTITNNGTYKIKYVKVKASCKNSSGTVIDTDWTYAVDSSWLNPGESNTFEMMIKDESSKIKTATVSVVYD